MKKKDFLEYAKFLVEKMDLENLDLESQNEITLSELVQKFYDEIDLSDTFTFSVTTYKWNLSLGLLDLYLKYKYETFEETELVYRWAKEICEERNVQRNYNIAFGWMNNEKK